MWGILFLGLLGIALIPAAAGEAAHPIHQRNKAKGVVIPHYEGEPPRLCVLFRVERVFVDYQRRGFFRIGLFPYLVAEGVEIEVRDPQSLEAALGRVKQWAEAKDKKKLAELRRVTFTFPGSDGVVVTAEKVRLSDHGACALEGGVVVRQSGRELRMPQASLGFSGPDAGVLKWIQSGHPETLNLLNGINRVEPEESKVSL